MENLDEKGYVAKFQRIPYYPVAFKSGDGALLYDYDGKEYIDFLASASSANVGHGNKEIAEAVYNQMKILLNILVHISKCQKLWI